MRQNFRQHFRLMTITLLTSLALLVGGGSTALAAGTADETQSTGNLTFDAAHPCLQDTNHVYEVCTAYIANSSLAVLVPYYKYAKSPMTTWDNYVTYRLGSRYTRDAYRTIERRVASWPAGKNEVDIPIIYIRSATSSLATNRATLVTQETWRVTTDSGRVIYREDNVRHVVTLQRVPSYILDKWVVTDIR